ncbi:hypothetical protein EHO61_10310 [Leptospira fluminis]|uniref:Uncharacterized protein n=1 Tax=Leptospira fluminis TaxID=2484979 RepID=A0A4R9GN27_9LEPT|nr:hypothetical protein [Leptospira fluminis]TGK17859.1 hypothetical protein EHO61_10310 [Leptospira fluminis]
MNLLSDVYLLRRLTSEEKEFLLALLKWKGISVSEWVKSSGFPSVSKETLVWKSDSQPEDLSIVKDWSREPCLIGRFDPEEKNAFLRAGASRIYDLNLFPLEEIPFFRPKRPLHPEILFFTRDETLYYKYRSLLRAGGSNAYWCRDEFGLPNLLKETRPGLLVLDAESFSTRELVEKLKPLLGVPFFPLSFCLINFGRENVYTDLARGLKDLSKAFFSPEDLLLFLRDRLALSSETETSGYQAIVWGGSPHNIREYEFVPIPKFPESNPELVENRRIRRLFLWLGEGAQRGDSSF